MSESAYEPNGLNNNVSEETQFMGKKLNSLGKKDQRDEPKKTTPSTANGGHDKETRNGGSNPNQAEPTTDESSGGEEPVVHNHQGCPNELNRKDHWFRRKKRSRCNAWFDIMKKYIIVLAVLSLSNPVSFGIGWAVGKQQQPPVLPSCPSCPEDWLPWRGECYYFSEVEGTWNSSQNYCSSHGAFLFVPGPKEEMDFVKRYKSDTDYWIGLWREEKGQPWKRPDGSVFNSSFEIGANGPCAYLDKESAGSTWCDRKRNYICTKSLPVA